MKVPFKNAFGQIRQQEECQRLQKRVSLEGIVGFGLLDFNLKGNSFKNDE